MRVFKGDWFAKFAAKEGIGDAVLCEAIDRADRGLIDADLGGGVIKQRIARPGSGKSGGYRSIIFFRTATRAIFAFGFAKNDKANLGAIELATFKKAAKLALAFSDEQMDAEIESGHLIEVFCND
jgi:hypothetical protein